MRPEVSMSYEEISNLPICVRALYNKFDIKIRPTVDLEKKLELCANLTKNNKLNPKNTLLDVCHAQRVLNAILACKDENELREPLKRIAEHSLKTNDTKHSLGKDALFELELLQYIKHRRIPASLGEPDIVIKASFGDYFIACKTINSLNNFETQLRSAYHQIEKYGRGCVAFNLEPHMLIEEPLKVTNLSIVSQKLKMAVSTILNKNKKLLKRRMSEGRFDGVIFQMTCIIDYENNLNTFTYTYYFSDAQLQEVEPFYRFHGLSCSLKGPLFEYIY